MELENQKKNIRAHIREKIEVMSPMVMEDQWRAGSILFLESDLYKNATEILLYSATRTEFNLKLIAQQALKDNKKIAFPTVINSQSSDMDFFYVDSLDDKNFDVGKWGIVEPKVDLPKVNPAELNNAVVLVPGVAFDFIGHRLGHGKGFYDKYFSRKEILELGTEKIKLVGVAFDQQIMFKVPASSLDVKMNFILTSNLLSKVLKEGRC